MINDFRKVKKKRLRDMNNRGLIGDGECES